MWPYWETGYQEQSVRGLNLRPSYLTPDLRPSFVDRRPVLFWRPPSLSTAKGRKDADSPRMPPLLPPEQNLRRRSNDTAAKKKAPTLRTFPSPLLLHPKFVQGWCLAYTQYGTVYGLSVVQNVLSHLCPRRRFFVLSFLIFLSSHLPPVAGAFSICILPR